MSTIDCLHVLRYQKKYFTIAGIWPQEKPTLIYMVMAFFNIFCSFVTSVSMITALIKSIDDYEKFSELLIEALSMTTVLFKLLSFKLKKSQAKYLVQQLENPIFASDDVLMHQASDLVEKFMKILLVASFTTEVLVFVTSLSGRDSISYPFSFSKKSITIMSVLMYTFQTACCISVLLNFVQMDMFIVGTMVIISTQFEILGKTIVSIVGERNKNEKLLLGGLHKCVKLHTAIIDLNDAFEATFSQAFLFQILDGLFFLYNSLFQMVHQKPGTIIFYQSLCYMIIIIAQTSVFCWFGNEIMIKSSQVIDHCYDSLWYERTPRVRKVLFMIMERAKRPSKITAGYLVTFSLPTLMQFLKTSYTYFTLMQQFYEED